MMKWARLEARTGGVLPGKMGGYRNPLLASHHDWPMARVGKAPEVTFHVLRDELLAHGMAVSHDEAARRCDNRP